MKIAAVTLCFLCAFGTPAFAGVLLPRNAPLKPLKVHREETNIEVANQVMQATLDQVFANQGSTDLEATYLFKAPRGMAVSGFATWVAGKKIESRVQEKQEAKQTYETAKRNGAAAALLSFDKKGYFAMKVARIAAGKMRRTQLRYEGILDYRSGRIDVQIPLRVADLPSVEKGSFAINIDIKDTKEITEVHSDTLPVKALKISPHHWRISYVSSNQKEQDDLRLYYKVRSRDIGLTFLTHRKSKEDGYFLVLAAPQELTTQHDIVKKDVVFIFDVSGSMQGEKVQQARAALKQCLSNMNPNDRFGIVAFSDAINPLHHQLQPVNALNVAKAETFVNGLEANGGTNIHDALLSGLKLFSQSDRPQVIVFLTDGQATVGVQNVGQILDAVKVRNTKRTRIFTFGVGNDVNRPFLERLGKGHRGSVDFIAGGTVLKQAVGAFYAKISRPVLSDLALAFGNVTTVMNYPNVLPDLYKGSQLLLVGRYRGSGNQNAALNGMLNKTKKSYAFTALFPEESDKNAFLPRLWARRRISYLLSQMRMYGEAQEARAEVIRLAKRYHIATRYTSMVSTAPQQIASLSPARVKPGDPEIRIRAPRDAKEVTAVFPFGVTKSARYEPDLDLWTVRFLIPRDTADGSYWVRLLVTTNSGQLKSYRVAYTVDTAAPTVELTLDGPVIPGALITLSAKQLITEAELRQSPVYKRNPERTRRLFAQMMADTREVQIRLPSGKLISLNQEKPGLWTGQWHVPVDIELGSQSLQVIATDVAGNCSTSTETIAVTR